METMKKRATAGASGGGMLVAAFVACGACCLPAVAAGLAWAGTLGTAIFTPGGMAVAGILALGASAITWLAVHRRPACAAPAAAAGCGCAPGRGSDSAPSGN